MRFLSPLRIPAADATTQVLLIAGTFAHLLLMVFVGPSMGSRSGTPCMKSKNGRDPNPACTAGYTHTHAPKGRTGQRQVRHLEAENGRGRSSPQPEGVQQHFTNISRRDMLTHAHEQQRQEVQRKFTNNNKREDNTTLPTLAGRTCVCTGCSLGQATCSQLAAHYKNHKAVPSGHPCVCKLDDPDDMSVLALTHATKPTADDE